MHSQSYKYNFKSKCFSKVEKIFQTYVEALLREQGVAASLSEFLYKPSLFGPPSKEMSETATELLLYTSSQVCKARHYISSVYDLL